MLLSHRQTLDGHMVVDVSSTSIGCVQYDLDIRGILAPDVLNADIG